MAWEGLGWSSVSTALAVGALTLFIVWMWRTYQYFSVFRKMGIPGPTPLPIVGNVRSVLIKGLLPMTREWGAKYGKVYGIFFPTPTLVIGDMELARQVLVKNFSNFTDRVPFPGVDRSVMKDSLMSLKGDHWKHVRNQLSPAFSSNKLKQILPAIVRVAKNLQDHVHSKAISQEMVELREISRHASMDVIAGTAFGLEVNSLKGINDPFQEHGERFVNNTNRCLGLLFMLPFMERIFALFGMRVVSRSDGDYLVRIIDAALEERRKDEQKYGDFLQLLVEAGKAGSEQGQVDAEIDFRKQLITSAQWVHKGLTLSEMHGNSLVFFFAGYDTVSAVLSSTLFCLAANPQCQRKAREEVDNKLGKTVPSYDTAMALTYIDMCMNEAMRLFVPGMSWRITNEDCELGGYHVKKGTPVMVAAAAFHHDPAQWPDPLKFDPERHTPEKRAQRHPFAFMPFGLGPRNCIGMRLAQLEIRLMIATVLQKYTLVPCEKTVFPPVFKGMSLVSRDGMWVRFEKRADAAD